MTASARSMLEQMYEIILKVSANRLEACQRLLKLIAANASARHFCQFLSELSWLVKNPELIDQLKAIYDPAILQDVHSGLIGEIITEKLGENANDLTKISKSLALIELTNSEDLPATAQEVTSE